MQIVEFHGKNNKGMHPTRKSSGATLSLQVSLNKSGILVLWFLFLRAGDASVILEKGMRSAQNNERDSVSRRR